MKQSPLVSILVPVFNVEKFIVKCARSLFEQTFEDIEYIFVDDCSPDNSILLLQRILKDYPNRVDQVKILHHKYNTGIAEVRNTLLNNAKGKYILFIDSDDWIEKSMVETLYQKALSENSDIVISDFYINYPDREIYRHQQCAKEHIATLKQIISLDINAYLVTMLTKRSLYVENSITFLKGINIGEDYIVCVQLFYYAKKICTISQGLYHYAQFNPNNYSRLSLKNIESRIKSVQQVENFCKTKNIINIVQKEIDGRKFIIKSTFLLNKQFQDFKKWKYTFPESNWAWRQFSFRTDYKIIYWLAEHHLFAAIRIILLAKKTIKLFRKK